MFTGIITDLGRVRRLHRGDLAELTIATAFDTSAIPLGASIACSGVCLTVVGVAPGEFSVQASAETLACTTIGEWEEGSPVNLENRYGSVTSSADISSPAMSTASCGSASGVPKPIRSASSLKRPKNWPSFIAPKGSVAIDGVSLTVNEVSGARFGVNIIPHTLGCTNFGRASPGERMNLEIDLIARYVARLLGPRASGTP